MAARVDDDRKASRWRMAAWGAAALLLVLPLAAMRLADGMNWGLGDFVLFGAMLLAAGGAFELAARGRGDAAYLAAVALALGTAFLLLWMDLAVGVIGSEDSPAGLLHGGVLCVALVGAFLARLRPRGMARALAATALAQALAAAVAFAAGWGSAPALTAIFVALWLASAWLFRKAARAAE